MLLLEMRTLHSGDGYWISGACYEAGHPDRPRPFEVVCKVINGGRIFTIEGTYRRGPGATSHPFKSEITMLNPNEAPVCTLDCASTGMLGGRLFLLKSVFSVVLCRPEGGAMSLEFEFDDAGRLQAKGILNCGELDFAFLAHGAPGSDRQALGNVVSILGGKQA